MERLILTVEGGYFKAPAFETHKRGKNWAAVLKYKPPFSFERIFLDRAYDNEGWAWYKIPERLPVVIEVGADYLTNSGKRHLNRIYGILKEENGQIVLEVIEEKSVVQKLREGF